MSRKRSTPFPSRKRILARCTLTRRKSFVFEVRAVSGEEEEDGEVEKEMWEEKGVSGEVGEES